MDFIKRELDSVKKELINGFNDPIPNEILTDFLVNGSKFVRSTLAICYLKALGCEITDRIIKLIAVGELIHSASLLHDDVIDSASNRRGKSTISNQFSDKISILSGDLLLSEGVKKLLDVDNNEVLTVDGLSMALSIIFSLNAAIKFVFIIYYIFTNIRNFI